MALVPLGPGVAQATKRSAIHLGREATTHVNATLQIGAEEVSSHVFHRPGGVKRIVASTLLQPQTSHLFASHPASIIRHTGSGAAENGSVRTSIFTRKGGSERMVVALGLGTCLSAYVFWKTNREEVFMNKTGRLRTMAISWETERKLARLMAVSKDRIEAEFGWILSPSDFRAKEIEAITRQIIRSAEQDFFEVRSKLDWNVTVCENTIPNAFCTLGGEITVFTGLYDVFVFAEKQGIIKDARCGLACILAHEIAHGFCRHTVEKISWLPLEYPLKFIIEDERWLQIALHYVVSLPYSRHCEVEADLVGLELMARAGFDPSEVPKYFALLDATPRFLEWLSTHPVGETRSETMQEQLPQALKLYEANKYRFSPPPPPGGGFINWLKDMFGFGSRVHGRVPLSELERRDAVKRSMVHRGKLTEDEPSRKSASVASSSVRSKLNPEPLKAFAIPRPSVDNDTIA